MMTPALLALGLTPRADAAPDRAAILAQQGCFRVTFQYSETEHLDPAYPPMANKRSEAIEWVTVEVDQPDRIALQHVLVSGPAMIKHWRQDWRFESADVYRYAGHDTYVREALSDDRARGAWVQEVTNVDDAPRYACSAAWSDAPGLGSWTCTVDAPLPRREKDNREYYDLLERTNTHRIEPDGWVHVQHNTKVRLDGGRRVPVAREYGFNTYERIPRAACQEAIDWWPGQRDAWTVIQSEWATRLGASAIEVDERRGVLPLWVRLFLVAHKASKRGWTEDEVRARAGAVLDKHVREVPTPPAAVATTP